MRDVYGLIKELKKYRTDASVLVNGKQIIAVRVRVAPNDEVVVDLRSEPSPD